METQEWQSAVHQLSVQISQINQNIEQLVKQQAYVSELFSEMSPILKEVMSAGTTQLQTLEEKGYFSFGREMLGVFEQIVTGFSAEDIQLLGHNIVGILNAIKGFTQPDMIALINRAVEPVQDPDSVKPLGMYGMLKATRDDDVRRGFGVMMEVLRQVGRGVEGMGDKHKDSTALVRAKMSKQEAMHARLAPRRNADAAAQSTANPAPKTSAAPTRAPQPAPQSRPKPQVVAAKGPAMEGFDADGYLLDPNAWTRDLAITIATSNGIQLSDAHWKLINFAREDFASVGKSPNIRRMTQGLDVSTKDIYGLFPQAPGRMIAKIAGVPKPGGCL